MRRCTATAVLTLAFLSLAAPALHVSDKVSSSMSGSNPRAMHLSLHRRNAMKSIWMTEPVFIYSPVCQFGSSPDMLNHNVAGRSYSYTAGGFNGTLHEAIMELEMKPDNGGFDPPSPTFYRCGDQLTSQFSQVFRFTLQGDQVSESIESAPWIGKGPGRTGKL